MIRIWNSKAFISLNGHESGHHLPDGVTVDPTNGYYFILQRSAKPVPSILKRPNNTYCSMTCHCKNLDSSSELADV